MSDRDLTTTRSQVFGDVECGTDCRVCGRDVEDGRRKTCSDYCGNLLKAVMAHLNWTPVRRRILERDDKTCQQCGFSQRRIDRAYDQMRELCEEQLPEQPEGPPLDDYDSWTDEEIEEHREEMEQWRETENELIETYFPASDPWRGIGHPSPESRLEVDHITPVADGGHPFDPANLQTLCEDCHGNKTSRENSERAEQRTPSRGDMSESLFGYVSNGGDAQ